MPEDPLRQANWEEAQIPRHLDQLAMPGAQMHRLVAYVTGLSLSHKALCVPQGSEISVYTGPNLAMTH